jgi:GT2 family glycosyltransferase
MRGTVMAPVLILTHDRLEHLEKTVTSLRGNTLAGQTDLFVAADCHRSDAEAGSVAAVRNYLQTLDGFKTVTVFEREKNFGVAENFGAAMKFIFARYDRMILLEDDNVTAPGFLQFMNDAFTFYQDDPRIGSISAFCPPFTFPDRYSHDVFALVRLNPWGVGYWRRYNKMEEPIPAVEYHEIFNDKKLMRKLAQSLGEEALPIIKMDFEGKIYTGDMKFMFWQYIDGKLTIYPRRSLVHNIGQDGSGTHMGLTGKWDIPEVWDKTSDFEFVRNISVDERIRRAHFNFYRNWASTGKGRVITGLENIGMYRHLKPILKTIQRAFRK